MKTCFMKNSLLLIIILSLFSTHSFAQPSNDHPSNATFFSPGQDYLSFSNVDASTSSGEETLPTSNITLENSVWFSFIPSANGLGDVSTCSDLSTFDTNLAIYAVGDCEDFSTWKLVFDNDDSSCSTDGLFSEFTYSSLDRGELYYIMVDGYSGAEGEFGLRVRANEDISSSGLARYAYQLDLDGTIEVFDHTIIPSAETDEAGLPTSTTTIENPMWFRFSGPASGEIAISTCTDETDFDTQIAVYEVEQINDLSTWTLVGDNDDAFCGIDGLYSELALFDLTPNATYIAMVDGYDGATGNLGISMLAGTDFENDEPCGAVALSGDGTVFEWNNYGAEAEDGINTAVGIDNSVWFTYTPPSNGMATFSTCHHQTNFDTNLEIFTATDCADFGSFVSIAAVDDACGNLKSKIELNNLEAGLTYYIMVDGYSGEAGKFGLDVEFEPLSSAYEQNFAGEFKVFPNPSHGAIQISIATEGFDPQASLSLHDMTGRQIMVQEATIGTQMMGLQHLPAGIYLLELRNGNTFATRKVIKQ